MKPGLVSIFLFLFAALVGNAQMFHKCTIYLYYRDDSADKHLMGVRYFNGHGKIISEEGYENYTDDDSVLTVSSCSRNEQFFYKDDTLLVKQISKIFKFEDSTCSIFNYNLNRQLISDTSYGRSNLHKNDFYGIDSILNSKEVVAYTYDDAGNMIEENRGFDTTFSLRKICRYDTLRRIVHLENFRRRPTHAWEEDGWEDYHYSQNQTEIYRYTRWFDNIFLNKTILSYFYEGTQMTREEMICYSETKSNQFVPYYRVITEYGYFPDKRAVRETSLYFSQPWRVHTLVYSYE